MFMALAISSVTAVPLFIACSMELMLPSRDSIPWDIWSRNFTASSEPKAFLICTCAAAWDRSGNCDLTS